jgi:NADH-quinone oxidoreductase subunit L
MMLIGNLALTGVGIPFGRRPCGLLFQGRDHQLHLRPPIRHAAYAFTLLIVSAGMTSFYSWRQFLMTFHGRYRGADMDPHEMHHDEEHDEPLRGEEDTGHSQDPSASFASAFRSA